MPEKCMEGGLSVWQFDGQGSRYARIRKLWRKMYVIAEIGINHDGSLDKALKLIEKAKECGANAVKFQSFCAERLVSNDCKKVKYQLRSSEDKSESHFEMIRRLEFNGEKLEKAFHYAKKCSLDFITTPYDPISLFEVHKLGVRNFKLASADLGDYFLHSALSKLKKDWLYLGTGMANINEIKYALSFHNSNKLCVMHCV